MKKYILLSISIFLLGFYGNAQREGYNWYFGNGAALDFSSGAPVFSNASSMAANEGCASISDVNGNLLFYTNGNNVWNKNHNQMQGGSGLLGSSQSAQSSIIVPRPSFPNQYFIFTVPNWYDNSGLNCYTVDMSFNGGLGKVINNTSPLSLNTTIREQVTAVKGLGDTYWIVTHERGNRLFLAYHVDSLGNVSNSPVVSNVGSMLYNGGNRYGGLKFSQDGKKLCSTLGDARPQANVGTTVELFDFDKATD